MRIFKWIAVAVMIVVVAFLIIAETAVWQGHQREQAFGKLPPGERQLAIFDAYAAQIERNYYDRDFIERKWPAERDEWRRKAAEKARDDVYLYDQIFVQLSQRVPSSHVWPIAPQSLVEREKKKNAAAPNPVMRGESGFIFAITRRPHGALLIVADVLPGSPAEKAGIEPGWRIVDMRECGDGQERSARFMTWGTPAQRLLAETGTPVETGDPEVKTEADFNAKYLREFKYTCGPQTQRPPFETRVVGAGIRYVRFDNFRDGKVVDQVLAALGQATAAGAIVDLRQNSGGHWSEEIRFMDKLLPEKAHWGTRRSLGGDTHQLAGAGSKYTGPLAILIGPITASAGEVAAAGLQDNHRATVLGRSTSGATLSASNFPLPDGGSVQVAFEDFLRASGKRIENEGVMPDIAIMPTLAQIRAGRDATLERALAELTSSGNPP